MGVEVNLKLCGAKGLKRISYVLAFAFLLFVGEAFCKGWNGLVPCRSTRLDVTKRLGKDGLPSPQTFSSHRYKGYLIAVYYRREGKASPETDVVVSIHVEPRRPIRLAKYLANFPRFRQDFDKQELDDRVTHVNGQAVYRNLKDGFAVWVQKDEDDQEIITRLGYFDPAGRC